MKSEDKKEFDDWINKNYTRLLKVAESMHADHYDLVHHTYHRIMTLKGVNFDKVNKYPYNYFVRAMYFQATRNNSAFKKHYQMFDDIPEDLASDYDLTDAFLLEGLELAIDRLSWFDRIILRLYCDGYNLTQVARESGIKPSVFHTSLHRSRKKLIHHFNHKK